MKDKTPRQKALIMEIALLLAKKKMMDKETENPLTNPYHLLMNKRGLERNLNVRPPSPEELKARGWIKSSE